MVRVAVLVVATIIAIPAIVAALAGLGYRSGAGPRLGPIWRAISGILTAVPGTGPMISGITLTSRTAVTPMVISGLPALLLAAALVMTGVRGGSVVVGASLFGLVSDLVLEKLVTLPYKVVIR